ncbi:MAG: molybdenum cofactor guanylyltransferase [Terriglobia bacterium]
MNPGGCLFSLIAGRGEAPLAALLTGLEDSASDWNIFVACDLPLLNGCFIDLFLRRVQQADFDAVVARTDGGWQPLCAAYRRTCIPKMLELLGKQRSGIIDVLPELRVNVISPAQLAALGLGEDIFTNVNTPEDWQKILQRMRDHRGQCLLVSHLHSQLLRFD